MNKKEKKKILSILGIIFLILTIISNSPLGILCCGTASIFCLVSIITLEE